MVTRSENEHVVGDHAEHRALQLAGDDEVRDLGMQCRIRMAAEHRRVQFLWLGDAPDLQQAADDIMVRRYRHHGIAGEMDFRMIGHVEIRR